MRFDGNVYYHELETYPVDVMMDEWRETARFLDQAGFTGIWIGEHHFWHGGYPVAAPNPVLIGTHLASVTEKLRVAQSACILPDHNPIRLAEDLAMLDQITRGRLDVGIARGTNSSASIQFNVNADRRDQETNYALFAETLDILIKAWTQDAFSHQGRFYTYPVPGWSESDPRLYAGDSVHYGPDGELIALGLMPKPYQKPHPPIYQAADSTASYAFAAERGIATTAFGRSFEALREAWTTYKETASRIHGRDIPMGETADGHTLNVMRLFHIAESQEQAEAEARDGVNDFFSIATGLSDNWARKGIVAADEELTDDDMNDNWFDFLLKRDMLWVGTPDFVTEKIERLRSELNCRHVTLWPNPGYIPFSKVLRGMELFAERVIPHFEKEEVAAPRVGS